jgi:hypothetical protein
MEEKDLIAEAITPEKRDLFANLITENLEKYLRDVANQPRNDFTADFIEQSLVKKREDAPQSAGFIAGLFNLSRLDEDKDRDLELTRKELEELLSNGIKDGGASVASILLAADDASTEIFDTGIALKAAKENGVGVAEAQKKYAAALKNVDVLSVDTSYSNGFNDIRVRNNVTLQAIEHVRGKEQGGAETDAFMDGYLFGTLNMKNAMIPRGSQTGDHAKDLAQARENLSKLTKDRKLSFAGTNMSINDALKLIEPATDGVDDADLSRKDAMIAGMLVSLHFQQENNVYYDGIVQYRLPVAEMPSAPTFRGETPTPGGIPGKTPGGPNDGIPR